MKHCRKAKPLNQVFLILMLVISLVPLVACAQPPAPTAKSQKKLMVAVVAEPDTLDPTTSKYTPVSNPIANNMFERLVDVAQSGELVPGIASWQVSQNGKEIEFTLRKGIKFHSGDPLTTKDVEFSHERALKSGSTYASAVRNLERLEILDDYRIKFHFKSPDVMFIPNRQLAVVSKAYYDRVGEDEFVKKPVGTGPYKFVEWKAGEYIDIAANDEYWGDKPSVKQARFLFVKEDTSRIAKLKAGEVDIIAETPYSQVLDVESAGFKTAKVPVHPTTTIRFHNFNPDVPWYDKRVRLAVAYAIDGDAIVRDLFQGIPGRYGALAPWELGYDPDLKPYPYDPAKAKQLLTEAGYPNGFEMPLYYFAGRTAGQKETVDAVVAYLNAVGIKANVQGIEAVQMLGNIRKWHDDPKAVYVGVTTAPLAHLPEPTEALDSSFSSASPLGLYRKAELDTLIEKIRVTMDSRERSELLKQAMRMLHDDVAFIPLWATNSVYTMAKNVEFKPTPKTRDPLLLIKDVKINN